MRFLCLALILSAPVLAQNVQQPGQVATPSLRRQFAEEFLNSLSWKGLVGGAIGAAIGQANDVPKEWGQGAEAYGKRYASSFAGSFTRASMELVIEHVDHEDPQYCPSERGSAANRLVSAVKQTIWTRRRNGSQGIAYGRIVSAFANGQLVNSWQPASNNSVGDGVERAFITLATDAGLNAMKEFIPFARPKASRTGNLVGCR